MNRRNVLKLSAAAGAFSLFPVKNALAQAQAYREVSPVVPTMTDNKIEVLEFFWYGCNHCFNFEPAINEWKKSLPGDVSFSQVPVGWRSRRVHFEGHQTLFYALEVMNLLDSTHQKVFDAMHRQNFRLSTDEEIFDFIESIDIDREEFIKTFKSFGVKAKVSKAKNLTEAYKIDGVPSLTVDGRFVTSQSMLPSKGAASIDPNEEVLRVVDLLILRQRQA